MVHSPSSLTLVVQNPPGRGAILKGTAQSKTSIPGSALRASRESGADVDISKLGPRLLFFSQIDDKPDRGF